MNLLIAFNSLCRQPKCSRNRARFWMMSCLALLAAAYGCDASSTAHNNHRSEIDRLVNQDRDTLSDPSLQAQHRGNVVFQHYCQICHGEFGEGDGFNSSLLDPTPRDFSNEDFWAGATNEKLVRAIELGGVAVEKTNLMPAWGNTLDPGQINDVVAYLRTVPESVKLRLESESMEEESMDEESMDEESME